MRFLISLYQSKWFPLLYWHSCVQILWHDYLVYSLEITRWRAHQSWLISLCWCRECSWRNCGVLFFLNHLNIGPYGKIRIQGLSFSIIYLFTYLPRLKKISFSYKYVTSNIGINIIITTNITSEYHWFTGWISF